MNPGLRVGIASQTPLVRMTRTVEELEDAHGPLPDPLPLDRLQRSRDYSLTPGGVGRMIGNLVLEEDVAGEWVTLDAGFPRDLRLRGVRMSSVALDAEARARYGAAKEVVWEAINGLPPRVEAPLQDRAFMETYGAWADVNAAALARLNALDPFDVYYVNDWQHLPQGGRLPGAPSVFHFHAPFAAWTPPGWRDLLVESMRRFDAVVVSTDTYAEALQQAGLDRPIHRVYPWLDVREGRASKRDVARFEEAFGIEEDDEVVLNVSRMDPVKAQDRLIRAFALVAEVRPQAKLALVGNGSFSSSKQAGIGLSKGAVWREGLERLARELGVEDRVVFTGHVDKTRHAAAFARADVFAFPSVAEGFGLAVIEAWRSGKPVVVNPGAGVSEIVREGENGLLARSADTHAFATAIVALLASPGVRERMGEVGRRTAAAFCDVRSGAATVMEILEAYAERRRPDLVATEGVA